LRDESLDDGATVGKAVLQREPVHGVHRHALVQVAEIIGGVAEQDVQPLPEAWTLGECHELTLEVRGAVDQSFDRG
jgi:hypothetical protein